MIRCNVAFPALSLLSLLKLYSTRLSLNVVALREIREGETLLLGDPPTTMARLIPHHWKVSSVTQETS